jgi:DNA invertase Pin-like site-specific DNA recombinase
MPRPLTDTQRDTVSSMLEAKSSYQTIADAVNCHISQIKRMARNKKVWGTVVAPKLGPQGRRHILSQAQVQV